MCVLYSIPYFIHVVFPVENDRSFEQMGKITICVKVLFRHTHSKDGHPPRPSHACVFGQDYTKK